MNCCPPLTSHDWVNALKFLQSSLNGNTFCIGGWFICFNEKEVLVKNQTYEEIDVIFFLKEIHVLLFIYLFIFGCVGSSFLCEGFL